MTPLRLDLTDAAYARRLPHHHRPLDEAACREPPSPPVSSPEAAKSVEEDEAVTAQSPTAANLEPPKLLSRHAGGAIVLLYVRTSASTIVTITRSVSTCVMNGTTNPPARRHSSPRTRPYANVSPHPYDAAGETLLGKCNAAKATACRTNAARAVVSALSRKRTEHHPAVRGFLGACIHDGEYERRRDKQPERPVGDEGPDEIGEIGAGCDVPQQKRHA